MNNIDTSGPAFPTGSWEYDGQGNVLAYQEAGMTLRDYFAAKAMAQLVHNRTPWDAAEEAYQYADALLKARAS